ncbi:MAG: hypothetical protein WC635_12245 [Bacteriovorax sp.]|jgi:hypothetical protein
MKILPLLATLILGYSCSSTPIDPHRTPAGLFSKDRNTIMPAFNIKLHNANVGGIKYAVTVSIHCSYNSINLLRPIYGDNYQNCGHKSVSLDVPSSGEIEVPKFEFDDVYKKDYYSIRIDVISDLNKYSEKTNSISGQVEGFKTSLVDNSLDLTVYTIPKMTFFKDDFSSKYDIKLSNQYNYVISSNRGYPSLESVFVNLKGKVLERSKLEDWVDKVESSRATLSMKLEKEPFYIELYVKDIDKKRNGKKVYESSSMIIIKKGVHTENPKLDILMPVSTNKKMARAEAIKLPSTYDKKLYERVELPNDEFMYIDLRENFNGFFELEKDLDYLDLFNKELEY